MKPVQHYDFYGEAIVCAKNRHKFMRKTVHAWRLVGVAKPLPSDVCRKCGKKRIEIFKES